MHPKSGKGCLFSLSQSRQVQRMRRGIKLVIPLLSIPPAEEKQCYPSLPATTSAWLDPQLRPPEGTVDLVMSVTKPCGVGSACVLLSQEDLINQHTPPPTELLGSFTYCLLMETTSAKTAAINRMKAAPAKKASGPQGELPQFLRPRIKQC